MSELIQKHDNRATIRWKLLTGTSALALVASLSSASVARADDSSHPLLWIELGGQLNRLDSSQDQFAPSFFNTITANDLTSPLKVETQPRYSIDEYGKLTFQPQGSDWEFSASIRYGKSTNKNHAQQQIANEAITLTGVPNYATPPPYYVTSKFVPPFGRFVDTNWATTEKHTILDFQAGKDVGLGLFGRAGSSTLNAGVRFVQFSSTSQGDVNADPTLRYPTRSFSFWTAAKYNVHGDLYWEHDLNRRSFRGVGPTLSWQGSAPIAGNADSSELAIDWGVNAAMLFGRQKASGYHYSSKRHFAHNMAAPEREGTPTQYGPYVPHDRSRNVTVPNIGGSIGLSFVAGDAKVSFGYRADLFVNAMDTGIDARKTSNMFFHGPYASISVGVGD